MFAVSYHGEWLGIDVIPNLAKDLFAVMLYHRCCQDNSPVSLMNAHYGVCQPQAQRDARRVDRDYPAMGRLRY